MARETVGRWAVFVEIFTFARCVTRALIVVGFLVCGHADRAVGIPAHKRLQDCDEALEGSEAQGGLRQGLVGLGMLVTRLDIIGGEGRWDDDRFGVDLLVLIAGGRAVSFLFFLIMRRIVGRGNLG